MRPTAYRGDAACKQQLLQRLRDLERADRWVVRPLHWNGEVGSLVGSLLRSEDLDVWEADLGLPKWLALALDGVFAAAADAGLGARAGIDLLDAITPGADLGPAGSRCLLDLLQDPVHGLTTLAAADALAEPLRMVAALHRDRTHGVPVDAQQWRRVRRAAVEATNALKVNAPEALVGACIEAAAWDPAGSRTVVSDTLRTWSWVMGAGAEPLGNMPDMSDEEDARIRALLARLYADALAASDETQPYIDVLELAAERHPEVYARMRANLDYQNGRQQELSIALWQRSVSVLRSALVA
jgi:hypothetical protein